MYYKPFTFLTCLIMLCLLGASCDGPWVEVEPSDLPDETWPFITGQGVRVRCADGVPVVYVIDEEYVLKRGALVPGVSSYESLLAEVVRLDTIGSLDGPVVTTVLVRSWRLIGFGSGRAHEKTQACAWVEV